MPDARPCPNCFSPIPPDAPSGGLCPKCLLRQGIASIAFTRSRVSSARGAAPAPATLAPLFPQLDILEILGQGGMGVVYKARQKNLDRLVALKILTLDPARDPAFSERFVREARTLARLSHPNIVGVHDFGETGGHYYFVMEFVDGASLREVLQAGRLSPQQALAVIPRICDALQYAHEEGIVHRDIKPENILLDEKGRVKIADFGLAKLTQRQPIEFTLTEPGQVMGTPAYMAPEQIEKPSQVDHRADIFSLGVVFYEMLTGELPLGRFAPPSQKVQVDLRLDEVVLRTLEKEPQRRYQHASDLKTDVESIDAASFAAAAAPATSPAAAPAPSGPDAPRPSSTPGAKAAESPAPEVLVKIRRPRGVTWIAIYAFVNAGSFIFGGPGMGFGFLAPDWATDNLPYALGLIIGVLGLVAGVGLWRLRRWGRNAAGALAFVGLIYFPIGTILSILIIGYLFRPGIYDVFKGPEGPVVFILRDPHTLERFIGKMSERIARLAESLGDRPRGEGARRKD